jgi:hypothetical protein
MTTSIPATMKSAREKRLRMLFRSNPGMAIADPDYTLSAG